MRDSSFLLIFEQDQPSQGGACQPQGQQGPRHHVHRQLRRPLVSRQRRNSE